MTTLLWILHGLLAVAFLGAGLLKSLKPKDDLYAAGLQWVEDFEPGQIKTIGALEVLGAIGVIAPVALGVAPIVSGVAAACLALTMVGAVAVHGKRGELPPMIPALVLGLLAAYVASTHLF